MCIPDWIQAEDFRVFRGRSRAYVIGWQPSFIVQSGRYTILQEIPFGGYRIHLKFSEGFWNWNHKAWRFRDIFEDFYATEPGSSTPINALNTAFRVNALPPTLLYGIVVDMPSVLPTYWFLPLPERDAPYWDANDVPAPPMPFPYVPP